MGNDSIFLFSPHPFFLSTHDYYLGLFPGASNICEILTGLFLETLHSAMNDSFINSFVGSAVESVKQSIGICYDCVCWRRRRMLFERVSHYVANSACYSHHFFYRVIMFLVHETNLNSKKMAGMVRFHQETFCVDFRLRHCCSLVKQSFEGIQHGVWLREATKLV